MGQGYVTLKYAKGPGEWQIGDDGVLKAHFEFRSCMDAMLVDGNIMSMTRDELKEMHADLYRKMTGLANDLCKTQINSHLDENFRPSIEDIETEVSYEEYMELQEIVEETLSNDTAKLQC